MQIDLALTYYYSSLIAPTAAAREKVAAALALTTPVIDALDARAPALARQLHDMLLHRKTQLEPILDRVHAGNLDTLRQAFRENLEMRQANAAATFSPAAPLVPGVWGTLPDEAAQGLFDQLSDLRLGQKQDAVFARLAPCGVRFRSLPFYPEHFLAEIALAPDTSATHATALLALVLGPVGLALLDGTSDVLHDLNKQVPITLSDDAVADYLRLFCSAIRGDDGRFQIVEDTSDIPWRDSDTAGAQKAETRDALAPLTVAPRANDAATWAATGTVLYADALFAAGFVVHSNGTVEIGDDDPIAGHLDIVREAFDGPIRYPGGRPEGEGN
jgi:hypothetical protein